MHFGFLAENRVISGKWRNSISIHLYGIGITLFVTFLLGYKAVLVILRVSDNLVTSRIANEKGKRSLSSSVVFLVVCSSTGSFLLRPRGCTGCISLTRYGSTGSTVGGIDWYFGRLVPKLGSGYNRPSIMLLILLQNGNIHSDRGYVAPLKARLGNPG